MSPPLPTFLILGAGRAGTTSLHHWLGRHPDVCVSRPKETQFFSLHHDQGLDYYRPFFTHHAGEQVVGESTPVYLVLPHVPDRIATTLPDASLIAVLREPVAQAYSTWWMFRSFGADRRTFEQAVADELAAPDLTAADAEGHWARVLDAAERSQPSDEVRYLMTGHYEAAIRRYLDRFDRDQLTLLLHDDLITDPVGVARTVADAVGVDHALAAEPAPPHSNEAVGAGQAWARRRTRRVPSARLRRLAERTAARLDRTKRPPLEPETRRRLHDHFAEANAGLAALIGRDLTPWTFDGG